MNASHNQITSIQSTTLKELSCLKHLDVSNNKLTHILDNQFASLTLIQSLDISHNELTSIQPFTFTDLKTLQTLNLSSNHLRTDDFLGRSTAIKLIDLQNNQYHQIRLSAFKSVGNVNLKKNPWNCSWLLNALAKKEHLVSNIQFGFDFNDFGFENSNKLLVQDVYCFDFRQSLDKPTIQKVIIVNTDCEAAKNEKKVTYVRCIFFELVFSRINFFRRKTQQ